jgi:hypothetical protein
MTRRPCYPQDVRWREAIDGRKRQDVSCVMNFTDKSFRNFVEQRAGESTSKSFVESLLSNMRAQHHACALTEKFFIHRRQTYWCVDNGYCALR